MDTLKKNQEEMLELKDTVIETKNDFDGFLNGLDTMRKELVSLRICQWTCQKLKCKENNY